MLRNIGPGIVVSGSVIGSGELINTPKQAAAFGFVLLWAIVISCLIKYWLQVELARHALVHNRTTIETLSLVPGPRIRGTGWVGALYFVGYTLSMATLIGIFSTTAGVFQSMFPLPEQSIGGRTLDGFQCWAVITFVTTAGILWSGAYNRLEKFVTFLVAGFSLSVMVSLVLIAPSRITLADLQSGLTFSIPNEAAAYAIVSLLGALGMTANELFMYPYWVLEKGYATNVGRRGEGDEADWLHRARGWIHVMKVDAAAATTIATLVTLAYYLVGAAVLQGQNIEGADVVDKVSGIFTESYGEWSYWLFMFGGFCTLYSTLVVVAAATGRMWADLLCNMQFADRDNARQRGMLIRAFTMLFLFALFVATLTFGKSAPASLVVFGQFINGIFNTPLIILGIVVAAWKTDRRVAMGPLGALFFVLSVLVILAVLAFTAPQTLGKLVGTLRGT